MKLEYQITIQVYVRSESLRDVRIVSKDGAGRITDIKEHTLAKSDVSEFVERHLYK